MYRREITERGFTLLELLVVVAILAIVGGGMLVAYDQLNDSAAEGVSAHTMSSLDSAVRTFTAHERRAPNELDSLIAADYPTDPEDDTTALTGAAKVAILPSKLLGSKTILSTLTAGQVTALQNAGITYLRYVDTLGNDPTNPDPDTPGSTVTLNVPDADGASATVGALLKMDIPSRIHETPRPGSGRNRGRGFAKRIGVGDPVLVWNPSRSGGTGGYDNTKIGAETTDVVLIFGLGNDATIVGSASGRVQIPSAPIFGKDDGSTYARYLLAYNVGPDGANFERTVLQIVMNTHGDFTDEMLSEHLGQKQ